MLHLVRSTGHGLRRSSPPRGSIVPQPPIIQSAVGGSGQITVSWFAVNALVGGGSAAGNPVTHYSVRHGLTEASIEIDGSATPVRVDAPAVTYVIPSLASATAYYVSVSAHNAAGESNISQWLIGTTT